ncbi:MAG: DUF1987 domain-containing protein [Bacteroidales bacterium]
MKKENYKIIPAEYIGDIIDEDSVKVEGTNQTPEVILDQNKGLISLKGYSLPENTGEFYYPVLEWIKKYIDKAQTITTVNFDLEYFNSSSFKMLLELTKLISKLKKKGKQLHVTWNYQEGDDDMFDSGRQLEEILDMEFEYICYK